jgi:peptidoglycan/LPS O-acetylase OafA/YrhL
MVAVLVWIQPELPSELGASDPGGVAEMQAWYWLHATNWWTAFHPWSYLPANTSPVWSLAVEEQFYLLWPLVVAVLPPRRLLHLALGLAALGVFFRWGGATLGLHPRVLRAATPGVFDPLALGAAVAVGMRDPNWRVWLVRWALPLGLTSCSLLVATVVPIDDLRFGPRSPFLLGLAAIIFSALLVRVCSVPPAWLCRGPLPTLGRVSYAVYLFHAFVLSGLLAAGWTDTLPLIAGTVVGSWSIALVSWHTFEKHWLALKRLAPRPALARQDWPYWGLQAAAIDKQPQAGHPRQVGGSAAG